MKLIITNDDGIKAQGLTVLADLASRWGDPVIVAPAEPQSGVGHQLTTDCPIRVDNYSDKQYRVWGTPGDCTRLGIECLTSDADWVLSGINHGANLGVDIYESGTVAAAREAAIHGYKAIAVSHYTVKGKPIDWVLAAKRLGPVLECLLNTPLEDGYFLNVNLPHPDHSSITLGTKLVPVDISSYKNMFSKTKNGFQYTVNYSERPHEQGTDIDKCFKGYISISKIKI